MQAREMFSEKSSGASHAVKIERAEDNQTCKTARAWEGLGRDIVSSSGARLAGCVCGGGGVFGGAVVHIRRRATMNNASKEAGRCSAREWGWGCPGKPRAKRTGNLDCEFSGGSSQRLRE